MITGYHYNPGFRVDLRTHWVSATRGKMKRIKRLTRVSVLEAHVQQGLVLTFLEKQLMDAWNELSQKAGGKGPEEPS